MRNLQSFIRSHFFPLLLLMLFFIPSAGLHAANRVKRILLVESYSAIDPWTDRASQEFRNAVNGSGLKVNYEMFPFGVRFQPGLVPVEGDIKALQAKLDSRHYDLVVVYNNDAADLFLDGRIRLPSGTPLLLESYYGKPSPELKRKLNMTALLIPLHSYESTRLGVRLLPGTRNIVLLIDATADGRRQRELLKEVPKDFAGKITVIDGSEYTTGEMMEKVGAQPPGTLLIFHSWGSSREDDPENSYTVLPRINKIFPGLILGRYDTYMSMGSDGGMVGVCSEQGKQSGRLAVRILNGEKASEIPYEMARSRIRLDYRAIQKFGIPQSRIPAGTEIVNVPPDFLTCHRVEVAVTGGVLLLFLFCFSVLLLFRRREQRKATMLFRNLPLRIFIFDRQERILHAHIPDPVEGMVDSSLTSLEQLSLPSVREQIRAAVREAFDTGEKVNLDFQENGRYRHDEFQYLSEHNPFHTEVVMCISADMTELYRAHLETGRLAERFRLTLESIGDGVVATDAQERVTLLNPVAATLTGFSKEDAEGKKLDEIFNIVSYLDESRVESPLKRALVTGKTVELANHTDLIARDGNRRHIADCASPIRDEAGNITGGVLVFRDVTQEYEKRDRLRMNSAILKMVEQIARIGYFRCTAAGEILLPVSEDYWPRRDGKPLPPAEWMAKDDLEGFLQGWRGLLAGETDELSISFSAGVPKRYFELRAVKSMNEISGRREYCGVIQDITHSRENERQVRDSLRLLKNIMDNLPGYIFVKNASDDFRYLMCNRRFGEMIGIDSDRIPGSFDRDIFPLDEVAARQFHEDDRKIVDSLGKSNIRERFLSTSGRSFMVQTVKNTLVQSDGTRLLIGMGIDISREYELEQQQKRTIESLDYASRCERIINQSLSMITVEPDCDRAISEMLRIIGENADADRAYIFLYTGEKKYISNKYEWARGRGENQNQNLQNIDMADFPVWEKMLLERREINVADMSCPPPALAAELSQLASQGIRSMLISGIWKNEQLLGFVGLDYTRTLHEFNDTSVHTVKSIANLFLLARERAAQLEQIAETASLQKQIVNNVSIPIIMFDLDYNVVMANSAMYDGVGLTGDDMLDRKCYKVLCGHDEPPEFCPFEEVKRTQRPYHFDFEGHGNHNYLISLQPLTDRNGKFTYILETAVDVTELYQQRKQQDELIKRLNNYVETEKIVNGCLSDLVLREDFDANIEAFLQTVATQLDCDRAYLGVYSDSGREYRIVREWLNEGVCSLHAVREPRFLKQFLAWHDRFAGGELLEIPDIPASPYAEVLREPGCQTLLCAPVFQEGRLAGILGIGFIRRKRRISELDRDTLRSVARIIALTRQREYQRRELEKSVREREAIFRNIGVPIMLFDSGGGLQRVNPAACEMSHLAEKDIFNRPCYRSFCGEAETPDYCPVRKVRETGQAHSAELNIRDREYIINAKAIFDRDGKLCNVIESAVDVTEINESKRKLEAAMEQALAADRAKTYFLATMSHELRTPLNAVLGFSELLQGDDVSPEDQIDYLRSINCAGSALLNLINDVLDLSKLEADQMNIAPVRTDLVQLAEEIISVFQLKAKQKNIALISQVTGIQSPVYVDHLRIRQILLNLFGNAIKFTHQGCVTVKIDFYPPATGNAGELSIQVADTGIGISEEQLKKIFDPFFQAESTRGNRVYEGSGLGLAISMRLVQRMGGFIEAASRPEHGSSFTVRLKNVRYEGVCGDSAAAGGKRSLEPPPVRLRVLLVDDVPMNLKVLQAMLRKLNIDSVCAESGVQALEILEKDKNFRFILTDLWMPEMDGEQLTDAVRAIPGCRKLRIVAVTADTEAKNNFSAEKFDDILSKPVTLETLQTMFSRLEHAV